MTLLRHPLALDDWSRRDSAIHRAPAWLKLLATLAALIAISLAPRPLWLALPAVVAVLAARLPVAGVLLRACVVLPFVGVFVLITWLQGHPDRALLLLTRSYVSALWAVLLIATTPMEQILRALRRAGCPPVLLDVTYFLWRYMHVVVEEAARIRTAALARGAANRFGISASTVASLFLSAHARAERVHRAMLARGATGGWQ